MNAKLAHCLILAVILLLSCLDGSSLAAVKSLDEDDDYLNFAGQIVADPLEPWNRAMFTLNDAVLDYVARPAYRGYMYVTPQFMRTGIKNFFHNLSFPVRFANNLLQGRGRAAGVEMSRFVLNTTAGLGGFFDVILSTEETGALKPSGIPFAVLVKALDLDPKEILYVGNSLRYDVEGAKSAGIKAALIRRCLFSTGHVPRKSSVKADFVFRDYRQLREYVLG